MAGESLFQQSPDQNRFARKFLVVFLFAFFYGFLLWLGVFFFKTWNSPMHWLIGVPGFFLAFLAYDWIEEFFEIKLASWWMPLSILLLGFLAFYVNAWFYYCNGFTDIRNVSAISMGCDSAGSQKAIGFINNNLWQLLSSDAFLYFWLAVLFGWLAKVIWLRAYPSKSA